MEWDEFSEEIQEFYYERNFLEMSDNWIDDVCDVYEYNDIDLEIIIFEKYYDYIEFLYELKYWTKPNDNILKDFYFSGEYEEVKNNRSYYEGNKRKFKQGVLRSKGEKYLYNILLKKKVKFEFGESDGCKNDKTNCPLLFDFIIFHKGNKIYVEIQGEQHFRYNSFFYKNKKDFKERLYKDKFKKEFAKKNGIFVELNYPNSDLRYLDDEINKKLLPLIK